MQLTDRILEIYKKKRTCLVSLVVVGGKTTSIYTLGDLLEAPVIVTTTTAMFKPDHETVSKIFYEPERPVCHPGEMVAYFSCIHPENPEKVKGLSMSLVDDLATCGINAIILNEADGANRRPLKAYADHEPVIPSETDLVVIVVGLDAIGKPVDSNWIHRVEKFIELTGADLNEPISWKHLVRLLDHPNGFSKGIPLKAKIVLLMNKYDVLSTKEGLEAFIEEKPDWVDQIMVTSMKEVKEYDEIG